MPYNGESEESHPAIGKILFSHCVASTEVCILRLCAEFARRIVVSWYQRVRLLLAGFLGRDEIEANSSRGDVTKLFDARFQNEERESFCQLGRRTPFSRGETNDLVRTASCWRLGTCKELEEKCRNSMKCRRNCQNGSRLPRDDSQWRGWLIECRLFEGSPVEPDKRASSD